MKIFIIPGYRNYPNKAVYFRLKKDFEDKGYQVEIFWPSWKKNLTNIMQDFIPFFDKNKGDKNLVFGFSYGAMISFRFSTLRKVDHLILCSLSPYFKEDMSRIPIHYKIFSLLRINDFRTQWIFSKIITNFSTPTTLLYGLKEPRSVEQRALDFVKAKPELVSLVKVDESPHNIEHKNYYAQIVKAVSEML